MSMFLAIRWENDVSARYYNCVLQHDLLGDLVLTIAYGSLHTQRGQSKHKYFPTIELAVAAIKRIVRQRRNHGYSLVRYKNTFDFRIDELVEDDIHIYCEQH